MITEALIAFVAQSVRAVLSIIPAWAPPADAFGSQAQSFGAMVSVGNGYFPVVVTGVCVAFIIGLKVAFLAWRMVLFIYHQFWGSD